MTATMAGSRPRIAILGAGAIGTLFAYHLAAHNDVTLVDVRSDIIAAIEANGGVGLEGTALHHVTATCDPSRVYATNFLFVFVKAPSTLAAIRPFAGKLNPATPIVSLQSGLGNEEAIKTALGPTVALVLGITDIAAVLLSPGRSRRVGYGTTVVGSAGASTATVRTVAALISDGGLECSTVYDIRPHQWGKLLANAAINPVAALAEADNGIVCSDADAAALARMVALESAAVARALRVNLPFADPWEYVRSVAGASADTRNSMAADLSAHHPTEVDAINGAIVSAGARHGVATPYNEALVRLVHLKQRG